MEKVVWQGTFAEAEERDNQYWASRTAQERLDAMLLMSYVHFGEVNEPMEKVAFKRKLGEEDDDE